ncbi:MAG: hypothetical protein Q9191_003689 [Dirinaria sp. TL-2023a]
MVANLTQTLSLLITANHILDYYQILTGFGHVSVRNPVNNATFFMTGDPPPALVRSPEDLSEFYVNDGSPVNSSSGHLSPYSERFIHQGILKRFPSQNSVVHSHARTVIPFGIAGVPFKPTYHMAGGFIGEEVPVFDIADYYLPNDTQNLLVNTNRLGAALASEFLTPTHNVSGTNISVPDHNLVLQRGHGFAVLGTSLPEAVYRAVYTIWNAEVETTALSISHASGIDRGIKYLSPQEVAGCLPMDDTNYGKDWPVWAAQVAAVPLYKNDLGYAEVPQPAS